MTDATATAAAAGNPGYGTKPYRNYVLTALTLVYILNFIDRGLLAVVAPQLVPELGLSDLQFGLLTGFGFALLYTIVGIPLAHMAETKNRVAIMSVCIALWSLMTALCGLAQEVTIGSLVIGGFWILLICRVGVGIGEAGCTPPANSLIADYYPPQARSTALGYYAMGVTLGTMLANLIGGPVAEAYGWRMAFFVLGAPGILIAFIFYKTIKEPPRGYTDPPGTERKERASFKATLKELSKKPSFWTMTAGATIAAFCGYGVASFQSLFVNREFGLSTGDAALFVNVPVALASAVGTFFTGWLAQRLYKKHPSAIAWLPGFGLVLCVPFYVVAFTSDNLGVVIASLMAGGAIKYGYLAAQYTIGQGVASMRARATATAILLFVVNLIGYGLGPLFIGAVSDIIFNMGAASANMTGELTRAMCHPKEIGKIAADMQAVCGDIYSSSLQKSLVITSLLYLVSGLMFLLTWRTLRRDMVA